MPTAKLEDILSGAVEIPDAVQHYKIASGDEILDIGETDGRAVGDYIQAKIYGENELARDFNRLWPTSCEWDVEWEQDDDA